MQCFMLGFTQQFKENTLLCRIAEGGLDVKELRRRDEWSNKAGVSANVSTVALLLPSDTESRSEMRVFFSSLHYRQSAFTKPIYIVVQEIKDPRFTVTRYPVYFVHGSRTNFKSAGGLCNALPLDELDILGGELSIWRGFSNLRVGCDFTPPIDGRSLAVDIWEGVFEGKAKEGEK